MKDAAWIKLTTTLFDNEKIKIIETMPEADSILVIWIKLLTLAGKMNNGGKFVIGDDMPVTSEMFASIFNRPQDAVERALDIFQKFSMTLVEDGVVRIKNWGIHQSLDALENKRKHDAEYQRKRREAAKQEKLLSYDSSYDCHTTNRTTVVRPSYPREEKRREEKREGNDDGEMGATRPSRADLEGGEDPVEPPCTLEEVQQYFTEKGFTSNPVTFFSHYSGQDWKLSKGQRITKRTWRSKADEWDSREPDYQRSAPAPAPTTAPLRVVTDADLENPHWD